VKWKIVLAALLAAAGSGLLADDAPPRPIPPAAEAVKAGPVSPPVIDGPKEVEFYGTFQVANLPAETGVDWDWPTGLKVEEVGCECDDATGKTKPYTAAVRVAGPPGQYTAKARLIYVDKKTKRPRITPLAPFAFTIKGHGPQPGPGPGPNPNPGPGPNPQPLPTGKVAAFVVVEDTTKAQAWRGDILGSPELAAFYKANKLKHRLIDVNTAADGLDPVAKAWSEQAKGKDLPWLFALSDQGKLIKSEKVKDTPAAFIAQITGEAAHARAMGNIPPPENRTRGVFQKFGSAPNVPVIPRPQWKPVNLETFLPPVHDQDGIGACNAFASITACEAGRAQAGLPYVPLSPGFLYGAINGGSDNGSMLEDGMEWMSTKGTVKVSTVGYLDWRTGRRNMNNPTYLQEAASYRTIEVYECPTFDHIASALQQGFFIVEGLMWYNNFTPDREGWLPARGSGGAGGHALCGYGLAQRNGVWGIRTRNSWGSSWGVGGNCVIPESLFDNRIGGYWAVRAVAQTPDGTPIPVPAGLEPAGRLLPGLDPINGGFRRFYTAFAN
jgi:hypothetical protein